MTEGGSATGETPVAKEAGAGKQSDRLAPAVAILSAVREKANKVPINPVTVGVGVGVGSAALVAALLYAGRRRTVRADD